MQVFEYVVYAFIVFAFFFGLHINRTVNETKDNVDTLLFRLDQNEKRHDIRTRDVQFAIKEVRDDVGWLLFPEIHEEDRQERLAKIKLFMKEFSPEELKKFMEQEDQKNNSRNDPEV